MEHEPAPCTMGNLCLNCAGFSFAAAGMVLEAKAPRNSAGKPSGCFSLCAGSFCEHSAAALS